MLHFDLNLSITMPGLAWRERFDAAARLGFGAVELWWPEDEHRPLIPRFAADAGLRVVHCNLDGGNLAAGERGLLNDPARLPAWQAGVPGALAFAHALGCRKLHALVGRELPGESRASQLARAQEGVAWLCAQAAPAGVTILVEALNTWETPGYLLANTAEALAFIAAVGAPNLAYQYDVYHMQRMEGNITATIGAHAARMGHLQVADAPGRGRPGTGELRFPFIFEAIEASGYQGYVGAEYVPVGGLEQSLGWRDDWAAGRES
jgi:hydroxypyruvate isomerase